MVKLFWHSVFELPLPKGHPFPMEKYRLVKDTLLHNKTVTAEQVIAPMLPDDSVLALTHSLEYIDRLNRGALTEKEMRRIGFPYSKAMVVREKYICGAMIEASKEALCTGIAFNMAGGTHHAFYDFGSAFCIFNDMAVAANYLIHSGKIKKAMIIDLDAHQGNGTAALFKNRNDVYVFNIYSQAAFPMKKEKSHYDIELKAGANDSEYLEQLAYGLNKAFKLFSPDIILYQAGVDLLACDKLGKLNLTIDGIRKRDRMIFSLGKEKSIPIAVCLGGGYSESLTKIVECHCNTVQEAIKIKNPMVA